MGCLFRQGGCLRVAVVGLLGFLTCGAGSAGLAAQPAHPISALRAQAVQTEENEPTRALSAKQKQDLLKSNFERMKRDADELATLAKSLQDDLNKSNEHVLSLQIVEKADKIEKLARRIKSVARGD
jgi:hypothetical protein